MLVDGTDPFAPAKPDPRLIKLLIRARQFNAALVNSDGLPFAALAEREGMSPSYFTRLVRLSYLAPDITQAILDGRQPRDLTADKLLAHSPLPLAWHEQRGPVRSRTSDRLRTIRATAACCGARAVCRSCRSCRVAVTSRSSGWFRTRKSLEERR